jgi:hypothetical protein
VPWGLPHRWGGFGLFLTPRERRISMGTPREPLEVRTGLEEPGGSPLLCGWYRRLYGAVMRFYRLPKMANGNYYAPQSRGSGGRLQMPLRALFSSF